MKTMNLPPHIQWCMDRLEAAGFSAYAVGGCVRDSLLGLTPHDFDLCTSALPEQTEEVFSGCRLILTGKKHGTVVVALPEENVEITTFRADGEYDDCRRPRWVEFVPDIREDLARRDFTINAMAWSPVHGLADPFGGRADLEAGVLRTVGDPAARFREDALRILRGVRFSVRYRLEPEPRTLETMVSHRRLMDSLSRERVFEELCRLLPLVTGQDLLRFAPILGAAVPELEPTMGFDQRTRHHAYDVYTHTALVTGSLPPRLDLRWAGLLHDIGKVSTFTLDSQGKGHFYGHAQAGAKIADDILRRLRAPNGLREQVCLLVELHMSPFPAERKTVRRWLARLGPERLRDLLILKEADTGGKGTGEPCRYDLKAFGRILEELLAEEPCLSLKSLAVTGKDLIELGIPAGKELGQTLDRLLDLVLEETLPNEKEILLAFVRDSRIGGSTHD